jgi:hypothetical protein
MELMQLIYTSQPFGFDNAILNGILIDARCCNKRDDVTGALICRADVYLQLLEGPAAAIEATFARIAKDDRHLSVVTLSHVQVAERLFPNWSMRDDPAHTWFWTKNDVAAGALSRATRSDLLGVFSRLAANPSE